MAAPRYPAWVTRWVSGQGRRDKRFSVKYPPRPLALADKVANRKEPQEKAACITEMSVVMACWKKNNFNDAACAKEIQTFYECVAKAENELKKPVSSNSVSSSSTANKLLKRFPQITRYV